MNLGEYLNGSAKDILVSLREKRNKVRDFVGDVIKTQARPALQKVADYTYSAATNRNSNSPMVSAIAQKSFRPIANAFGNIGGIKDFRVAMDKTQTPEARKMALSKANSKVMGFVGSIGGTGDLSSKINPLLLEARKYKTAEEFVNSYVYRGLKDVDAPFNARSGQYGTGVYFSSKPSTATAYRAFGENSGYVLSRPLENPLEITYKSYDDLAKTKISVEKMAKELGVSTGNFADDLTAIAKKEGRDGIRVTFKDGATEEVQFAPKIMNVPKGTNLTSLWEQAQKLFKK